MKCSRSIVRHLRLVSSRNVVVAPLFRGFNFNYISIAQYHATPVVMAPKNKKDKEKVKEEVADVVLPDLDEFEIKMDKRIARMEEEFKSIRGGRPSADMFNHLVCEAYGSHMSLEEAGQATLKGPTRLTFVCYDKDLTNAVVEAIRDSGMGINPIVESDTILVNIPKPSKESRDALKKQVAKLAENFKQDIRNIRKDAMDEVKKLKSAISEDDTRRISKEIDALSEKKVDDIIQLLKVKDEELSF